MLDKPHEKEPALFITAKEFEYLTNEYAQLVSHCFQEEFAYADIFNMLANTELAPASLDESRVEAYDRWAEEECD
jgi:hypothetical protein